MTQPQGILLSAIKPELTLVATAVAVLTVGTFLPRQPHQQAVIPLAATGVGVALGLTLTGLGEPPALVFFGVFAADTVTDLARAIILAATLLVILISVEETRGAGRETEYYALVVLSAVGAIGLAAATDLMMLIVAYLISSVPLYMLAGFRKDTPGSEAAMKTYLMAALFSVLMLFGLVWLFGAAGTTLYHEMGAGLSPAVRPVLAVALVLGFGGLLFKIAAVPGHFWLPDTAEGAPAPVVAFLTTIPKIGGLLAAGRLLLAGFPRELIDWPLVVAVVAAITMTVGNLAALWQTSPRRLLGYSAVAQAGFLLMGVAALGRSDLAVPGLVYYLAAYAAMNLAAWAVVAELPRAERLTDYAGLWRTDPGLALALLVSLLSLAGIPPLAGFFGKLLVFSAAWDAGLQWLVGVAAANVVASLFYYLRWIAPAYFEVPATHGQRMLAGAWAKTGAYAAALATLALGLGASALVDLAAGIPLLPP
jgi:NADH-quinone oxidoreductase subunit N